MLIIIVFLWYWGYTKLGFPFTKLAQQISKPLGADFAVVLRKRPAPSGSPVRSLTSRLRMEGVAVEGGSTVPQEPENTVQNALHHHANERYDRSGTSREAGAGLLHALCGYKRVHSHQPEVSQLQRPAPLACVD